MRRKTAGTLEIFEKILSKVQGHIYFKNTKSVYQWCNDLQAIDAGLKNKQEIFGLTDFDMPWKEDAESLREADRKVIETQKPVIVEEKSKIASGETLIWLSRKEPFFDDQGKIIGLVGISVDITDLKNTQADLQAAKEAAEAANKAKTEFLENMRHDIRTPLTGIVGFADILKMESDNLQIKEYAENLVASSHALLDLLDEVLEAIRVSSGEIPKLKKKFQLKETLEQVIALNCAKAAQKKINLSLEFDSSISRYVIGDKVRLHRVALELVANALNFTDSGYVKLTVKLVKQENKNIVISLIIEDSGIGIPKEKQQEIYLQFKRLTPSYEGIYKGAGLGLSVVKQFIDELNAEIYVESEPKKGTRFTCFIPLQEPLIDTSLGITEEFDLEMEKRYSTTYAQEIKPPSQNSTQNAHHSVLVVEDNPIAQSVAKSILSKLNCSAEIADTGKKAVEMWKSKNYDLIFMDIGLPDMDGYEVSHIIRVQELPKKTHVPIIALTAHAGDENKKRCIDAGINAVLTKPLTAKSCEDIVDAFIPSRQKSMSPHDISSITKDLPEDEEALFNLTQYPFLDIEEGVNTTGNKDMLLEMLGVLIQEALPSDLAQMQQAFNLNDWDKTQQIAHKIKGGAVYVGTVKMKMACQYLERYWKAGHRDLFVKLYHQTVSVIEGTIVEVGKRLKNDVPF